jgi:hypothetical protein
LSAFSNVQSGQLSDYGQFFGFHNGSPCHLAVQDIRAEVDAVGPDQRSRFKIDADLSKELDILQRLEDASSTDDTLTKIKLTVRTVGKE